MKLESKNILYFSPLNWNDNWQRQQEFASRMAEKNKVLFVSPIGFFNYGFINTIKKIVNHFSIQKGKQKEIRNKAPKNIVFKTLIILPRHNNRFFEAVNKKLLLWQIRLELKKNDMQGHLIFWTGNPVRTLSQLIEPLQPEMVVYDNAMRFEKLEHAPHFVLDHEKELVQKANFVVADNDFKKNEYESWGAKVYKIPQAVNLKQFDRGKTYEVPQPLKEIHKPIIGYYGVLRDVIDFSLLDYVAKKLSAYSFIFVGNIWEEKNLQQLRTNPNVHFLPAVQHSDLPSYLAHFDVTLIPYLVNDYTKGTFPNKLFEYFSFLKPVVAEPLQEFEQYKDYMYLTSDKDTFARYIEQALRSGPKNIEDLLGLVQKNTWEARYRALETAFEESK
jgi:hypothetical protein